MACGCSGSLNIPPAGAFGPQGPLGPGLPAPGAIGFQLGAGELSTDTRLGGASPAGLFSGAAAANFLDWQRHPVALVLVLVLLWLFIRQVMR